MLCNKIAAVQNGQMLLMEPSNRIVEERDSPERWIPENSENANGEMNFDLRMDIGMDGQMGFNDQTAFQETATAQFNEDSQRDDLSPQFSLISSDHMTTGISSLTQQQQRQQSYLPYSSWDIQDSTNAIPTSGEIYEQVQETDLYSQLQQNFNGAFGINGVDNVDGMWNNSGTGLSIDGLGSGPEAVE
jgi:hypothetical protein